MQKNQNTFVNFAFTFFLPFGPLELTYIRVKVPNLKNFRWSFCFSLPKCSKKYEQ